MSDETNDTPVDEPVYVPEDASDFTPPGYDQDAIDAASEEAGAPGSSAWPENLTDKKIVDGDTAAATETETDNA